MYRVFDKDQESTGFIIATYNVHRCIGNDQVFAPARTAAAIRELNADIIALQEVGWQRRGPSRSDQFEYLRRHTGYHVYPGLTKAHRHAHFGNAILTRHPVQHLNLHNLTLPYHVQRGAMDAEVEIKGRSVRIINVHLGLGPWERRIQVNRLIKTIKTGNGVPTILLGDMNKFRTESPTLKRLSEHMPHQVSERTYPSQLPVFRFDRIFMSEGLEPIAWEAVRTQTTQWASDHLPLRSTVRFAEAATQAVEPALVSVAE